MPGVLKQTNVVLDLEVVSILIRPRTAQEGIFVNIYEPIDEAQLTEDSKNPRFSDKFNRRP
jgi:hypothetical protein